MTARPRFRPPSVGRAEESSSPSRTPLAPIGSRGSRRSPLRVLRCISEGSCHPGPGALPGENERTVWILFYPDLADSDRGRTAAGSSSTPSAGLKPGYEIFAP